MEVVARVHGLRPGASAELGAQSDGVHQSATLDDRRRAMRASFAAWLVELVLRAESWVWLSGARFSCGRLCAVAEASASP